MVTGYSTRFASSLERREEYIQIKTRLRQNGITRVAAWEQVSARG